MELSTDNLNLNEINVSAVPHDVLFPDELNQHLKGQLEFLMHTNGMLQRQINDKEVELEEKTVKIDDLNKKIYEYNKFTTLTDVQLAGNSTHLMGAKIIELSKKLKDKTVETESLKTKYSKLQQKLFCLQNSISKEEPENNTDNFVEPSEIDKRSDSNEELKILQEKLSQTNVKFFDIKNQNVKLKTDLKSANKILQQELGDTFTSIQNISNNSNWRGRAQQIIHLQQKNVELQEKLTALTEKEPIPTAPKVDTRKQIIELLQKDLTNFKNELEDTRKKLNGARARIKVLENESNSMKNKVTTMESKSQQDEKMILFLTNQMSTLEERNNYLKKEKNTASSKLEEESKRLQQELSKEKTITDDLRKILEEKDKKIQNMENNCKPVQRHSATSSCAKINQPADINKMKILEVEVNRLLELITILNKRVDEERLHHSTTQLNYKKERQRAAKLELKLSRLELETSFNKPHSYSRTSLKLSPDDDGSVSINAEALKNSLELAEESVAILKTKLDIMRKEKDMDYQRFSTILTETSSMLLKYNNTSNVE